MSFYFRDARTEEDEVEANIEEVDRIFEIIDNINKRGKPTFLTGPSFLTRK